MTSRCGKCEGSMTEGFLLENSRHGYRALQWAEGAPDTWLLGILRLRGRRRLPIRAWRCTKCGFLESYADDTGRA